ncbi:TolC family protein [Niabella ginsenosidivorans]|uniref:TolC family protein n=1 Tax=Niabella ginsenosidivorans TaxID=1176587 RepID=UPI0014712EA6|nr:TolC family protein [Niabella ginsenosidivorans]
MKKMLPFLIPLLLSFNYCRAQQSLSLQDCIHKALENNTVARLARQSVETRQQQYNASKLNLLPKADLLAGYNHLSKPLTLDMGELKDGIVEGAANQSVNTANTLYNQITGNELPKAVQDRIYSTTESIINAFYPTGNPEISRQDFVTAGILFRQPIYLGGKLKALQELAKQQLESGKVNLDAVNDQLKFSIASQYIQILYLNSMLNKQAQLVTAFNKTQQSAEDLLKAEIIPPYQKKWADVIQAQGRTSYENLKLEKENALLQMKQLMGMALTDSVIINDTLADNAQLPPEFLDPDIEQNPDLRLLNSKHDEANIVVKTTKTANIPNVFGIANYQFLQKNLPAIMPPWMVGIEMQWSLLDWVQNSKKVKAARSLSTESELLIRQKKETLNLGTRIAQNKILSLRNQMLTLKMASSEAANTAAIVQTRLENSLASVKDVNDAQQLQFEAEKIYYTSLLAYKIAIATYFYILGKPETIAQFIN